MNLQNLKLNIIWTNLEKQMTMIVSIRSMEIDEIHTREGMVVGRDSRIVEVLWPPFLS